MTIKCTCCGKFARVVGCAWTYWIKEIQLPKDGVLLVKEENKPDLFVGDSDHEKDDRIL